MRFVNTVSTQPLITECPDSYREVPLAAFSGALSGQYALSQACTTSPIAAAIVEVHLRNPDWMGSRPDFSDLRRMPEVN